MTGPLAYERERATFDSRTMTYFLQGGEKRTKRKERVRGYIEQDPVFRNDDRYTMDRYTLYKRGLEKQMQLVKRVNELQIFNREDMEEMWEAVDQNLPTNLHYSMFIPTILSQASDEQQSEWLPLAFPFHIYGTYAQTELGHGTNVSGLETTASYDKKTQEFVLHSPTITSTKWWPGGLGKTSTHCILMAKLIIDEKDYGVHPFFVQIRSLEDHTPLPGVTLGDIGPKMGYESVDNGYMRFNHVRIPRTQMLNRYANVSEDGVYSKPPHEKLSYGTMVFVRAMIIVGASATLSRAVTIAIRYSCVRKQGYLMGAEKAGVETTVLDFSLQQYRLFPLLAGAFAFHFTGKFMKDFYESVTSGIRSGNFEQLGEIHATAAGLKSYCTLYVSDAIEECRKACGGHGYLKVSGLVHLFADYVPACTYEGDNYVLIQQTAKYLFKACADKSNAVSYLQEQPKSGGAVDLRNRSDLLSLYRLRAKLLVFETFDEFNHLMNVKGLSYQDAWNTIQPAFPRMINAHCKLAIAEYFASGVDTAASDDLYKSLQPVLNTLCDFHILYHLERDMLDFMEFNLLTKSHFTQVKLAVRQLMKEIRPNAIALVDSFNISDHRLNSALGRYDGNVYEALLKTTEKEPLNQTAVPQGYEEFIKPMVHPASRL